MPQGRTTGPSSGESTTGADAAGATDDPLLRAVARISEPSPSSVAAAEGTARRPEHAPGQIVARRYHLDEELGRGGMGVVWGATHLVTRRRVAIKFLLPTPHSRAEQRRRFLREARAASTVEHPNVVQVLDVFELEDETPVIVMELLTGETLRDRLEREGRLSLDQTVAVLLPVVAALAHAHDLGIVHRDLKPENVFLARSGSRGESVKVLDFGIAKLLTPDASAETESLTGTGSTLGTPSYMSPEQTLGERGIDHRSDVWALGVMFYEALAGARPLQGSSIGQVVMQLATEGIKPLEQAAPGLPREVTSLVMRMLERDRTARPQNLRDVHERFGRLANTGVAVTRPSDAPVAPTQPSPEDSRETPSPRSEHPQRVETDGTQSVPSRVPPRSRRPFWLALGVVAVATTLGSGRLLEHGTEVPSASPETRVAESRTAAAAPVVSAGGVPGPITSAPAAPIGSSLSVASIAPAPQGAADAAVAPSTPGPPSPAKAAAAAAPRRGPASTLPPMSVPSAASASSGVAAASVAGPVAKPAGGLAEKPPF